MVLRILFSYSRIMFFRSVFIIFLIFLVSGQSYASLNEFFRILSQTDHSSKTKLTQVSHISSLSPAPSLAPQFDSSENCDASVAFQCHNDTNKMVACLPASADGSRGSTLLIRNDGESNLKLSVTLLPVNYTYNDLHIQKHEVQKINISSNIRDSSSIRVDGDDGGCTIQLGALAPYENMYKAYATPSNAMYVLFGAVVLIGGVWACCSFRNKGRHLDGVPYQELELEMEHQKQSLPYVGEAADNWDESWDDDWDEEKAVRSPGKRQESRLSNGAS